MWPIAARNREAPARLALVAVLCVAFLAAGCGNLEVRDPTSSEKLAYLVNDGSTSRIMITALDEGEGRPLLEWPESSDRFEAPHEGENYTVSRPVASGEDNTRRFSFSNDGRYFVASLKATSGSSHPAAIATDGSREWQLPAGAVWMAFSPDSSKVAYWRQPSQEASAFPGAVFDLVTGKERILAQEGSPQGMAWIDNQTLIFTDTSTGTIFAIDIISGEKRALTPEAGDAPCSYYAPPVSLVQGKIAVMKHKWHDNIWSLDPGTGQMVMVTNNSREKWNAMYLPGTNKILFQEGPQDQDHQIFSDLFLLTDDGRDLSMLINDNFYFNGLFTVSLASGKIAYQHAEEEETSVWVTDPDGGTGRRVAASRDSWLGDPNFAPVAEWGEPDPLAMEIETEDPADGQVRIQITNPTGGSREAVLRLFPGKDLELLPSADPSLAAATHEAENQLSLQPGESREMLFSTRPRVALRGDQDMTLLITLAVAGTPPVMSWRDLAL